ncbi:MAG: hypothetical protein V4739_11380 [Pseudomonadota bacterium]
MTSPPSRSAASQPGTAGSPAPMAPGDEAPPGTPGTGDDVCRRCGGSGQADAGVCPDCQGSGTVTVGIGGG